MDLPLFAMLPTCPGLEAELSVSTLGGWCVAAQLDFFLDIRTDKQLAAIYGELLRSYETPPAEPILYWFARGKPRHAARLGLEVSVWPSLGSESGLNAFRHRSHHPTRYSSLLR